MQKTYELRVPFGERDGRLYAPDQVDNGIRCGCTCPGCGAQLKANHPKDRDRRRAYFSHYHAGECSGGFETALHQMAIQIIHEAREITVPGKSFSGKEHIAGNYYESWSTTLPPHLVQFESVAMEQTTSHRLRPDLTATLPDGTDLFIEVAVTHKVEDTKAQTLDNLMEVDLSAIERRQVEDLETLRHLVLHGAPRCWYQSSWMDGILNQSAEKAAIDAKLKQARDNYQAHLARAQLAREAHEKHLAMLDADRQRKRLPYEDDLVKAVKLSAPENVRMFRNQLKLQCEAAIEQTQKEMEAWLYTQTTHPVHGSELETNGDWIVKTHPLVWKAYVLKEFVFSNGYGASFAAGKVLNAVERWFGFWAWAKRVAELKEQDEKHGPSTGLRLLSDHERQSIVLPIDAIASFLDRMTCKPYGYLEKIPGGHQYIVRYRDPFTAQCNYFAERVRSGQAGEAL